MTRRPADARQVKRADWVTNPPSGTGHIGFVIRVARDGSWADVKWRVRGMNPPEWTKRMPTSALKVEHTIPIGDGWEITDMTREEELGA